MRGRLLAWGRNEWSRQGGYREVLQISVPLILSTGAWSLQQFVDRVFLTWYSREAVAAALPAGMLNFTFGSFFLGTASYVNTFVAQYSGADRDDRVGPAVWQGVYFGLAAGLLMLAVMPFSGRLFEWVGHAPAIRIQETAYFRILCIMGPAVTGAAISSFFSGRGETLTVMWVNFAATGVNVVLDYAWIFGHWGFPEAGIRGAAWATVVAQTVSTGLFLWLMLRRKFRVQYNTGGGWRPDRELMRRLLRFGAPNGVQLLIEILGFATFILLVGRLGEIPLAATNITFNVNTLAFLPMLGVGVAVSTLVGRYQGRNRSDLAERSTWSAFVLVLAYMGTMAAGYWLVPGLFMAPYAAGADPSSFLPVKAMAVVLLKFVAVYCVFDGTYIVFSSAIKGAGDTRYVLVVSTVLSWTVMVLPTYLGCAVYGWGVYWAWVFISGYIVLAGLAFLLRFRGGKWKSMQVIESAPAVVPAPEDPDIRPV